MSARRPLRLGPRENAGSPGPPLLGAGAGAAAVGVGGALAGAAGGSAGAAGGAAALARLRSAVASVAFFRCAWHRCQPPWMRPGSRAQASAHACSARISSAALPAGALSRTPAAAVAACTKAARWPMRMGETARP